MSFTPRYEEDPVSFEIVREEESTPPLVRLSGEMDLRAATDLRETLVRALAEGDGFAVLDLADLTFIDSTIISVFIMARKRAETSNGEVRLRNVPARIQRILSITGIDTLFPLEEEAPEVAGEPS